MTEQTPHIEKDTPFNMAMLYYYQIQQIMFHLSESLCDNDVYKSREWLEELYTKVCIKLDCDEEKDLEDLFKKLRNKFTLMNSSESMLYHNQSKILIRVINRKLLRLMAKYNMIFPEIKVQGLDKLFNRYNIKK